MTYKSVKALVALNTPDGKDVNWLWSSCLSIFTPSTHTHKALIVHLLRNPASSPSLSPEYEHEPGLHWSDCLVMHLEDTATLVFQFSESKKKTPTNIAETSTNRKCLGGAMLMNSRPNSCPHRSNRYVCVSACSSIAVTLYHPLSHRPLHFLITFFFRFLFPVSTLQNFHFTWLPFFSLSQVPVNV